MNQNAEKIETPTLGETLKNDGENHVTNSRVEAQTNVQTNAAVFSCTTKPVPVVASAISLFPASINNNNHGLIQSRSNNSEAPHSICFKCVKKFTVVTHLLLTVKIEEPLAGLRPTKGNIDSPTSKEHNTQFCC